jgi:hypothetical protein
VMQVLCIIQCDTNPTSTIQMFEYWVAGSDNEACSACNFPGVVSEFKFRLAHAPVPCPRPSEFKFRLAHGIAGPLGRFGKTSWLFLTVLSGVSSITQTSMTSEFWRHSLHSP